MTLITKDWLINYINTQPEDKVANMVGRALVVLLDRQTEDERAANITNHTNSRGFTAFDAKSGSVAAKTFLKYGGFKERWQWERWVKPTGKRGTPRIAKYARQLNEAAEAKAHRAAEVKPVPTPKPRPTKEFCGRCAGTGQFITMVENGKPKGPGGICFRCEGKGHQTEADHKRNEYYDTHRQVYI